MDADVAGLVGRVGGYLTLHGRSTTALGVLDGVLLACLAGNSVVTLLAIVVAVDEVHIGILVDRHLHLVDGEILGLVTLGNGGTG